MHWVIQRDLYSREGLHTLLQALERFGADFTLVDISDGRMQPDVAPPNPVIALGANTVARVAKEMEWRPGCFANDRLSHDIWHEHLGTELLNDDGVVCRLADVPRNLTRFFLRPVRDSKAFTGRMFDERSFPEWINAGSFDPDIFVLYARPKEILREYRFFAVADQIVTASLYRQGGRAHFAREIDPDIWRYAESIVRRWSPGDAYVLDVALTAQGQLKVIEYNGLAAAQFYEADVMKLVAALIDYADQLPTT